MDDNYTIKNGKREEIFTRFDDDSLIGSLDELASLGIRIVEVQEEPLYDGDICADKILMAPEYLDSNDLKYR